MFKLQSFFSLLVFLIALAGGASAGAPNDNVYSEYPKDKYLVGIGETRSTDNFVGDKRVAEVMARLEIAKQIKVRLREETIDIMCEGGSVKLFKDLLQCRNEFIMVVEVTVDEFLAGSRIVSHWEQDGIVYALAVMPKVEAVKDLDSKVKKSAEKSMESIEKAKKGDRDALNYAHEEYMKAVTYDREREMIEGVRSRASDMFDELEKELVKLGEKE